MGIAYLEVDGIKLEKLSLLHKRLTEVDKEFNRGVLANHLGSKVTVNGAFFRCGLMPASVNKIK
jgi:hypothetical protein